MRRPGLTVVSETAQGRALAQPIGDAFARRGLPRKADVRRDGLFFLNQTVMPALIPEINRVHNYGDRVNQAQREALAESTCAFLGRTYQPPGHPAPDPHVHTAQPGVVTPDSPLRGPALVPATQAEQYLLARPHGSYSAGDVARIGDLYYTTAGAVGLDALLVVAQMAEETAHLASFWSQRPRRNFAGIGVTGQPGVGLSFPDLKTAVRVHTGRLLACVLPTGTGNPAQQQLINEALKARPLPDDKRGVAAKLHGSAGTWAQDPKYAVKLAAVANQICQHGS